MGPARSGLIDQVDRLTDGGFSLASAGAAYPPAPVLLALAVGGSAVGLGIISSFLAGSALHAAWERMVRREIPQGTQLLLIASATLVPSAWFVATQDLAAIGGLTMLVIALEGFFRFAFNGETSGGFTAGLFLAAAFLFDPAALAYALSLVLATPLLASARYRRQVGSIRALVSVLCFPVVAVLLGWAFLEWRFAGSAFAFITTDLGLFQSGTLSAFGSAAATVARDVGMAPVYLAVGLLLVIRRPIAALGYGIPIVGLILVRWSGLEYSQATTILLLTFMAMVSVPYKPPLWARWLLIGAATTQLVLGIVVTSSTPGFSEWIALL